MKSRTDLAIEFENIKENDIIYTKKEEIEIYETETEKNKFITIAFSDILNLISFEKIENEIIISLKKMINKDLENIMVVGLGNNDITCDSIGPFTASKVMATRHIMGDFANKIGLFGIKGVSVITPGVLGKTGIETAEIIKAITDKTKPDAVIIIDALSAMSMDRLFKTVQLTNAGISPGSGVKNSRKEISQKTLGIPVIALGVPTVVNSGVIAEEISGKNIKNDYEMILTPKDSDLLAEKVSEILSNALNVFLQPNIERQVILNMV